MKRSPQAGMTLLEVMVAVSLVGILSLGMVYTIRLGMDTMARVNRRFDEERRSIGAQRILEQQLANFVFVSAECRQGDIGPAIRVPFFEGESAAMRMVSTYSLQEAHRGLSHMLEYQVVPGDAQVGGVRLVVNEVPYSGPRALGQTCLGQVRDPIENLNITRWAPIVVGRGSFVLADRLRFCRFSYLERRTTPPIGDRWITRWTSPDPPAAIRIDMEPIETGTERLRALSLTIPVRVNRKFQATYED